MDSLYGFLLMAHSGWRYIALILLVIAVVKYVIGWLQGSTWSDLDRRIGLFTTIGVDIQFLLGLVLWAVSFATIGVAGRTVRMMEHPVIMIVAAIVMHVGWSRARRSSDAKSPYRTAALTFVITGLLVALGVARVTGYM